MLREQWFSCIREHLQVCNSWERLRCFLFQPASIGIGSAQNPSSTVFGPIWHESRCINSRRPDFALGVGSQASGGIGFIPRYLTRRARLFISKSCPTNRTQRRIRRTTYLLARFKTRMAGLPWSLRQSGKDGNVDRKQLAQSLPQSALSIQS